MTNNQIIEEKWNAYSHGFGAVLAIFGSFLLLNNDLERDYEFGSVLVYCVSLILLFFASTAYHSVPGLKNKQRLRILDHISIYYLIAGTYTPICLLVLEDSKGWLLFWMAWGIAAFGTILKLFFTGKFEKFSLVLYAVMGWLVVIDITGLTVYLTPSGLFFLALGGAFYTIGIVFYAIKKIPFNHLIWHFFVLGGAICHWWLIYTETIQ